jgi:hypothetical protein
MTTALTREQAIEIVSLAIAALRDDSNEKALKSILSECDKEVDPMKQFQLKFSKLIPKVLEVLGEQIQKVVHAHIEPAQAMGYIAQVQTLAMDDVNLSVQVGKISRALGGDFSGLYEEDEGEEIELID